MYSRFAPSTTGFAHPGTMLSALLSWLDAKQNNLGFLLRLENLDKTRCKDSFADKMKDALIWLGIDWDKCETQSDNEISHEKGINKLAELGVLYECFCTRKKIKEDGKFLKQPEDGSIPYPNTCKNNKIKTWKETGSSLRLDLPNKSYTLKDLSGITKTVNPKEIYGDVLLRRKNKDIAYHLASVIDDYDSNVSKIVRGIDLINCTHNQMAIRDVLEIKNPKYYHHFLLLEQGKTKLSKLHKSIDYIQIKKSMDAKDFCGLLAKTAGIIDKQSPITPKELLKEFDWQKVRKDSVLFSL